MEFAQVIENKVVCIIDTDRRDLGPEWVAVRGFDPIQDGDDFRHFHTNGKRKSSKELVEEGLIEIAPHQILDGDVIRDKTPYEQVVAGLRSLQPHEYLDDEKKTVNTGSLKYLRDTGKITDAQYNEMLAEDIRELRNIRLQELDRIVTNPLRWESMSDEDKTKLRTYRQALLDITKQETFPFQVEWPSLQ